MGKMVKALTTILVVFVIGGCEKDNVTWNVDYADFDYTNYGMIQDNEITVSAKEQESDLQRTYESRATERIKSFGWKPESSFEGDEEDLFYQPSMLYVDNNEQFLYIADVGTPIIKKFSIEEFKFVVEFGKGPGSGPGEYTSPFGYSVMPNGEVLVADSRRNRIIRFDGSGEIIDHIRHDYPTNNVSALDNETYVMLTPQNEIYQFSLFDLNGKELKKFGQLVNDINVKGGVLGQIVSGSGGEFVYTLANSGYILGYSDNQEVAFYRTSVQGESVPRYIKATIPGTNKEALSFDMSQNHASYLPLNIWGNELFIYVFPKPGFSEYSEEYPIIIDAFDLISGDYLYSIPWPTEECIPSFVTKKHVYTGCTNEVVVQWNRPSL